MNPIAQYHPQAWTWEPPMVILRHCFPHTHQAPEGEGQDEKEAMFEKLLTPSDVGKLNRLVVPKQHAEKYFPPLGGGGGGCVDCPGEKGLLLSFEDESSGKLWRFRYSYWSSSQSYVVTRGWSRFVKEKRLDAGDTVCFERLRNRGDRLYINCRRRERNESTPAVGAAVIPASLTTMSMAICGGDGGKATAAPTQSKRLRLFGVNLDCVPEVEIDAAGVGSSLRNRAFISVNDLGDSSL